jgi:hypothetical protein
MTWNESRAIDELISLSETILALKWKFPHLALDPAHEERLHAEIVAARAAQDHERYLRALRAWWVALVEASDKPGWPL